jgi:ferredoxin-thioredoxin reductase catalytic subunit
MLVLFNSVLSRPVTELPEMVRKHDPDAAHLRVRLDGDLLRQLEQAAKRNNASLNGEVVERLRQSFTKDAIRAVIKETAHEQFARIVKETQQELQQFREEIAKSADYRIKPGLKLVEVVTGGLKDDLKSKRPKLRRRVRSRAK